MQAMDRSKYEVFEYFISKEGKWQPQPILPEPGVHPEIDVVFPVLHGTFGEDGTVQGPVGTGGFALRGRGRAGLVSLHGQGDDEARMPRARAAGCGVRDTVARFAGHGRSCVAAAVSDVREAGKSGFLGRDLEGTRPSRAREGAGAGRGVRPQDHRGARNRRAANSSALCSATRSPRLRCPCEILPSREFLRLRRQIPSRSGEDAIARGSGAGENRRAAPAGRGVLPGGGMRRHGSGGFLDGAARRASSISTRSIPFQDSPRSACIPRCGNTRAWLIPS